MNTWKWEPVAILLVILMCSCFLMENAAANVKDYEYSAIVHRKILSSGKYIGVGALRKNNDPVRGQLPPNGPYHRGCTPIERCKRSGGGGGGGYEDDLRNGANSEAPSPSEIM